jgi:hypothetical protein
MKRKERYIAVLAFLVHGGALHAYANYPKLVSAMADMS